MNNRYENSKKVDSVIYSPIILHPRISKGELANHYQCSLKWLRKHIMNDDELEKMNITTARYKKVHCGYFTVQETAKIYEVLLIRFLRIN